MEKQAQQILALRQELREFRSENSSLKEQVYKAKKDKANLDTMHGALRAAQEERDEAITLARAATDETLSMRMTKADMKKEADKSEDEIRRLKTLLDRQLNTVSPVFSGCDEMLTVYRFVLGMPK